MSFVAASGGGNTAATLREHFDLVMADPPHLSDDCLTKTSVSIKYLSKPDANIVLCTGTVMKDLAQRLLGLELSNWKPGHAKNLSNDFSCFTNYNQDFEKSMSS